MGRQKRLLALGTQALIGALYELLILHFHRNERRVRPSPYYLIGLRVNKARRKGRKSGGT